MNIPTLPLGDFVQDNTGKISTDWLNFFRQLTTELQNNASQEGNVIPQQETTNITTIAAGSNSQSPRLIYDSTANTLKFVVNGTIKTVTVT